MLSIGLHGCHFTGSDWLSPYAATEKHVGTVTELLQKSSCSSDELFLYLTKTAGEDAAKAFRADGAIDWSQAPKWGYVLDQSGAPKRTAFTPQPGEIIDRYGPPDGRFVCPVIDGKPFSYAQRSLPYLEDPAQYHQYEVIGDFSKLEEYIKNCSDQTLALQIEDHLAKWYPNHRHNIVFYKGQIAPVSGWGNGGGLQYELPLPVEWLVALGLLRQIK